MPAISVIVPTRGRHALLARCLGSLCAQTLRDFEIVLVDNNEPQARVAGDPALGRLLADPRLRLVEDATACNAAGARNRGLREARGEWITYLDDDDAYRPRKLEAQLACALRTRMPVVSCGLAYHVVGRTRVRNTARGEFAGDELLLDFPAMPTVFHRASDVRFNEALSAVEDVYFYLELVRGFALERVRNVPEPLVDVYLHAGPRVTLNAEAAWQGSLAVWREFAPGYSAQAAETFRLRSRLVYCKVRRGRSGELLRVSWQLARLRGIAEARSILGALLFQIPLLRPYLVT